MTLTSQGSEVKSLEFVEARMELRRLKGDLGRVGGLIKQCLANGADRNQIHKLLNNIDILQEELKKAVMKINDK